MIVIVVIPLGLLITLVILGIICRPFETWRARQDARLRARTAEKVSRAEVARKWKAQWRKPRKKRR
jgi:hypothetical protein